MDMTRQEALDLDHDPKWRKFVLELDKIARMENEKLLHCEQKDCTRLQERIKAFHFCMRLPTMIAEREEDNEPSVITGV